MSTRPPLSVLTASLALCGCAGVDARSFVPALVLRGSAERRTRVTPDSVREQWGAAGEVTLRWTPRTEAAQTETEAVEAEVEAQADAEPVTGRGRGLAVALMLGALGIAAGAQAQPVAEEMAEEATVLDPAMVAYAMRRYGREPVPEVVVAAAVRTARIAPRRIGRVASRARAAGWVPWLRLGARRGQQIDYQLQADADLHVGTDDEVTLEASLTFRLDRLVFAPEELPLLREERTRAQARTDLARLVLHVYFERRRLQLERDLLGRGGIEVEARIAEAAALLDAFTAGEFSRMMRGP